MYVGICTRSRWKICLLKDIGSPHSINLRTNTLRKEEIKEKRKGKNRWKQNQGLVMKILLGLSLFNQALHNKHGKSLFRKVLRVGLARLTIWILFGILGLWHFGLRRKLTFKALHTCKTASFIVHPLYSRIGTRFVTFCIFAIWTVGPRACSF